MTGMTCTRCRTEDPSRSSSASLRSQPSPPLPPPSSRPVRLSLPPSICPTFVVSPSGSRSGYLLRGRCGLNLINSMRHLDKCAPRTRIQRIIFILIHRSSPLLFPGLRSPPPPPSPCLLSTDPSSRSPAPPRPLPRLTGPRSGRSNRFFGYQIPDSYSSSASTLRGGDGEGEEEVGWEVRRKKDAFIRSHLAGIICLFDVASYLIR